MKRKTLKTLRFVIICLIAVVAGILVTKAVTVSADAEIEQIDAFIEANSVDYEFNAEPETVSLSYAEWKEQQTQPTEPNVYEMDVWTLGNYLWDISELDTTRALKIITYEGYEYSPLSYYVACCCWVRATEGYWGYGDLFSAFGEADTSYGEWMDCIDYEDWAVEYLRLCYEAPTYCRYCNGMTVPEAWIYEENGIYCWN